MCFLLVVVANSAQAIHCTAAGKAFEFLIKINLISSAKKRNIIFLQYCMERMLVV